MKLWPYESFEVVIPRRPEDVVNGLKTFLAGGKLDDALQYEPMSGTITGSSFVILPKALESSRSPQFYFYGHIRPEGEGSRVSVTLKSELFVPLLLGVMVLTIAVLVYVAYQSGVTVQTVKYLAPLPVLVLFMLYAMNMMAFWSAQARKTNLIKIMTYSGTRIHLESIN